MRVPKFGAPKKCTCGRQILKLLFFFLLYVLLPENLKLVYKTFVSYSFCVGLGCQENHKTTFLKQQEIPQSAVKQITLESWLLRGRCHCQDVKQIAPLKEVYFEGPKELVLHIYWWLTGKHAE